jgi:ketosteroid isomerase-like protein
MERAALPLTAAGVACAMLLACHTGIGGHLSEPDKDEIRKVIEESTRTVLPPVSDLDAYVKLYYADDARVLPPNHATVTGREAIAALYRSSGSLKEYELTVLAIDGRNDLAYVHSAYQVTVTPPGAVEPVGDRG